MNLLELLLLAAVWGASFLFLKLGAPAFGPLALIAVRCGSAALLLAPLLLRPAARQALRRHAWPLLVLGASNSAFPFVLFAYGALHLGAGTESILNAMTPLSTALIAWLWLRAPLSRWQALGMLIGFAGVLTLVLGQAPDGTGEPLAARLPAALAALGATVSYGFAANYAARHLRGVEPRVVTFGCMFFAALLLLPCLPFVWPATPPAPRAWGAALALGVLCTGLAYILYFRLIARAGASFAASVTFVVPASGMLWGGLFLGERITGTMLIGAGVILLGVALASGRLRRRRAVPRQAA